MSKTQDENTNIQEYKNLNDFENELLVVYSKFIDAKVNSDKLHWRLQQFMHKMNNN